MKDKYYFRIYKCKCGRSVSLQEFPEFYKTEKMTKDEYFYSEKCFNCYDKK